MVKAQQIEKDGTPFGPVRNFTRDQWDYMKSHFGKKLRWVSISNEPEETNQEVSYPEMSSDEEYLREKLGDMTKRTIVSEYNLPKEDVRLSREELINKVVNKL